MKTLEYNSPNHRLSNRTVSNTHNDIRNSCISRVSSSYRVNDVLYTTYETVVNKVFHLAKKRKDVGFEYLNKIITYDDELYNLRFQVVFDDKGDMQLQIMASIYDMAKGIGNEIITETLYEEQFRYILKSISAADVYPIKCPVSTYTN